MAAPISKSDSGGACIVNFAEFIGADGYPHAPDIIDLVNKLL